MMRVTCSGCGKLIGEKPGGPEDEVTHSLCEECAEVIRTEIRAFEAKEANGSNGDD